VEDGEEIKLEKPIDWRGSSLKDIKSDDIFTPDARREAGRQLSQDKETTAARYKAAVQERSKK
jgi:phage-related protein